jgi:hypothetical protein
MPIVRNPWRPGPEEGGAGRFTISATEFTYRHWRDMPLVWFHGLRLRRGWGKLPGAVGLATGSQTFRPVSYTLSVWRSHEDLRRFLRSPAHVALVRDFKRRQAGSASVVWEADRFALDDAWSEGLRRLEAQKAERART